MKKIILLSVIIIAIFPITALAKKPVLFFSDITSGPKTGVGDGLGSGAIITVWGKNLGSSQGNSKVFVGGKEVAYVYYWTKADGKSGGGPADLFTYHGMQEIAFSVPSTAADGVGTISIEVEKVQSNTLPFTVRAGNIYHVKTSGNDSTGDGSWGNPWNTVSSTSGGASTKVSPGDIIYVANGVQEINSLVTGPDLNSGIYITSSQSGTPLSPIALVSYPGARVLAQGDGVGILNYASCCWVISKYVVKAGNIGGSKGIGLSTSRDGRIVGNEITDREEESPSDGCANGYAGAINGDASFGDSISNAKVFGNYIHDWGCDDTSKFEHTTYFKNRSGYYGKNLLVESPEIAWNLLLNNKARGGLHFYDTAKSTSTTCGDMSGIFKIHHNVVVNQRGPGISINTTTDPNSPAVCLSTPIEIYNNLLVNNGLGPEGIDFKSSQSTFSIGGYGLTSNIKIYNNTLFGYGDPKISSNGYETKGALFINDVFNGTIEWVNNIVYDTKNIPYQDISISSMSKITVHKNNLWYSGGDGLPASPPSWDNSPLLENPNFLDSSNNKFSLKASSPALDSGSDTSSVVTNDMFGTTRPLNKIDIGAFEYIILPPTGVRLDFP